MPLFLIPVAITIIAKIAINKEAKKAALKIVTKYENKENLTDREKSSLELSKMVLVS